MNEEKRRLETDVRLLELAAELTRQGKEEEAWDLTTVSSEYEHVVRSTIARSFGKERARREIRRIRALAEGRLVREEGWAIVAGVSRSNLIASEEEAFEVRRAWTGTGAKNARAVRVTRVRRA